MNNPFKRREQILQLLESSDEPISGKQLSQQFEVSRQIIVKDISILKSQNYNIDSTSRGYVVNNVQCGKRYKRVIVCQHDNLEATFQKIDTKTWISLNSMHTFSWLIMPQKQN